jgi:hypothetical protein
MVTAHRASIHNAKHLQKVILCLPNLIFGIFLEFFGFSKDGGEEGKMKGAREKGGEGMKKGEAASKKMYFFQFLL